MIQYIKYIKYIKNVRIAKRLQRLPLKQLIAGSNPATGTRRET